MQESAHFSPPLSIHSIAILFSFCKEGKKVFYFSHIHINLGGICWAFIYFTLDRASILSYKSMTYWRHTYWSIFFPIVNDYRVCLLMNNWNSQLTNAMSRSIWKWNVLFWEPGKFSHHWRSSSIEWMTNWLGC